MALILDGTNGLSDVDGSASTPAIRGTDANTGIFFPAADTIGFAEGGVEAMRIDSSGNVGIGTSSPSFKLDVVGTTSQTRIRANATTAQTDFGAVNSGGALYLGLDDSTGATTGTAYASYIYSTAAKPLLFYTNGSLKATLDTSGNLGLGVTPSAWVSGAKAIEMGGTAPTYLAFNSTSNAYGYLYSNCYYNGTNNIYKISSYANAFGIGNGGAFQWYIAPSGTAGNAISFTQAMTLDASGNLGIGTSSPAAQLHVLNGGGNSISILGQYGSGTRAQIGAYANQVDIRAYNGTNDVMSFTTGASERMRIDSSGNVGIGTNAPQARLDISNTGTSTSVSTRLASSDSGGNSVRLVTTQNANGSVTFNANAGGNGSARDIIFQQTGSEKMRINTVGSREFGTYNTNDVNTGETTIAWGNVSSTTFDITTLFPNVIGLGSGVGILIQVQTWTGGGNSNTSSLLSGARASGNWSWTTINNLNGGSGNTVSASASGNVVTISFSQGNQYGKARIMLLATA